MIELKVEDYGILKDDVAKVPFNMLMARSVIEGHADGRVFVDSCKNPQTFYIVHSYGMTYLCGNSANTSFNKGLFAYFCRNIT